MGYILGLQPTDPNLLPAIPSGDTEPLALHSQPPAAPAWVKLVTQSDLNWTNGGWRLKIQQQG